MKHTKTELAEALRLEQFPRAATYDPEWVIENQLGPNVLWLTEFLSQVMELEPGMRVLDLGCGRAASSIFLAKEFGVRVWATDLWIKPGENWARVRAAGLEDQVCPIYAEARTLPFANDFFDAIISMDAYHYFGTDDLYLGYLARFVRPGGQVGIVVPGLLHEFPDGPPDYLKPHWDWDFCCFHTPDWWRRHWEKTGKVEVEVADRLPDGWKHWLNWLGVLEDEEWVREQAEMVRVDAGRNLGFTRLVARRKPDAS